MKKFSIVILLAIALLLSTSCTSTVNTEIAESENILSNENSAITDNNFTEEYIISCLNKINEIDEIEPLTKEDDTYDRLGKKGYYISQIFFSSIHLDQGEIYGNDLISKGTDAGGCVEIYANTDDAKNRNDYLSNFDNNTLLNSGSHICYETLVIRTSKELSKDQQAKLEQEILDTIKNSRSDNNDTTTFSEQIPLEDSTTTTSSTTIKSNSVFYSSNDYDTAIQGSTGVFAYKNDGTYDVYWIVDFDSGYIYNFADGNGDTTCDKIKIKSGNLNNRITIDYNDCGETWSYGLFFKYKNSPSILTLQDNDGFLLDYYATNLTKALAVKETKTIRDVSAY